MKPIPFVGDSYTLGAGKASISRSINCYPVKTQDKWIMPAVDGLVALSDLGSEVRGTLTTNDRTFWVVDSTLYEQTALTTFVSRGTLSTSSGPVEMVYGVTQLVLVDGPNGYVLTLATNVFQQITDDAFYGSRSVSFLDNEFIFVRPNTGQYYIAAINDATNFDALDFTSAESQPDNLEGTIVVQRRLLPLGSASTEIHFDSGNADFPFEREGTTIEVGCLSTNTARVLDNTVFMLGRDRIGGGRVYRLDGYRWVGVSTQAVDEALQRSTDLSAATAYAYQKNGLTFYALNAPGLTSTWVYEVASGKWHERCDQDANGQYCAHRAVCHTYAFGHHLVGGSDGAVYRMDEGVYTTADARVVERISPHWATPNLNRVRFNAFHLSCTTGAVAQGIDPQIELLYSDDSGKSWSNAGVKSMGKVGERFARITWRRLGISRDRVWRIRFSGNARFDLVNAQVETEVGNA